MEFKIKISGGSVLQGFLTSPGTGTKAFIIMVHGIGEHIMRYQHWAERFVAAGIGFRGVDLPGHGNSEGKRGHIRSYAVTDEILNILNDECNKNFRGLPVFLYGHSLGGGIVLKYLLSQNPDIKGAVITSPWIRLAFQPSEGKIMLARIMKNIFPTMTQPTGLVVEHLSHNPEVVSMYKTDTLVHGKISVSLFCSAVSSAEYILNNVHLLRIPVLLLHGSDDKITSPEGSSELAAKSEMITFKIWEGGYHELHNEPFSDKVFDFILEWIEKRISST